MAHPVNGRGSMNRKPTFKPGTVKRFLKYITKYFKKELIIVMITIILSSVATVFSSVMIQKIIDEVINPGLANGMSSVYVILIKYITIMIVVFLIGIISTFIHPRIMAIVTQGMLCRFRVDMFEKMQKLPIKYYDTHPHGEIMSTYTNDTDALRQLIGQVIPQIFQSLITAIAVVTMMIGYSLWLSLIVFVIIISMLQIVKKIASGSATYMVKQQKSIAAEEGFVEEFINGQKVVKVFNYEPNAKKSFDEFNEQLFKDSEKANTYSNILMPIMGNVGNIMYVIVAFIGGIFIIGNVFNLSILGYSTLTIGIVVAYLTFVRSLSQTVGRISSQIGMIMMGLAGASRIFELLDETPEEDSGYVTLVNFERDLQGNIVETNIRNNQWAWKHPHSETGVIEYVELKGDIVMENVDFAYKEGEEVLHDINIYAYAGQKIALVGATGAGKTTITNLLNRFYDIPDGKIRYDGINIRKIKKPDLRKSLGIVLQDINLFTGTVIDNIRYGRLDATDSECIEAAKKANAHDFITRLPNGYETILNGNGSNLSQGQRQLLSIARAEVADTPVMILDEATSSIDTRTEALVQKGMDELMKGRTVFVIAHRLSTVRNSDAIMVMDHGRIIERGTHDQLIKQKGTYYQLYTGAFELE
ncbi:MAG: ABC transporter ATP-binding protein [Candidatus Izemoplasmatales bacterium]